MTKTIYLIVCDDEPFVPYSGLRVVSAWESEDAAQTECLRLTKEDRSGRYEVEEEELHLQEPAMPPGVHATILKSLAFAQDNDNSFAQADCDAVVSWLWSLTPANERIVQAIPVARALIMKHGLTRGMLTQWLEAAPDIVTVARVVAHELEHAIQAALATAAENPLGPTANLLSGEYATDEAINQALREVLDHDNDHPAD